MNCEQLSDRMPEVARGETEWGVAEREHLAGCPECASEWRLVRIAARGSVPIPELDLDAITSGVHRAMAAPAQVVPFRPRRRVRGWAVGLAAAAMVLLAVAVWGPTGDAPDVAAVPAREPTLLPELDGLLEGELEVILASYEQDEAAEQPLGAVPRLGDLTDAELELLMEEVEG